MRKALQRVLCEPGIALETNVRPRAPAEVDGGAGERVVHRDDGVAVAGDAAAVAERTIECLAERERSVLDGVMRSGLQIAHRFEHEVEARVKRKLFEQVVVEAGTRRDPHTACAVERQAHTDARLGSRTKYARLSRAGRCYRRRAVEHVRESLQ